MAVTTYEATTTIKPSQPQKTHDICGNRRGIIAWSDGTCKQLYTQGPCNAGEWVVPDRKKGQRKGRGWKVGKCECRPGFTVSTDENTNTTMCQPPTVAIAKFLNNNKSSKYLQYKAVNNNSNADSDYRLEYSEEHKMEKSTENIADKSVQKEIQTDESSEQQANGNK